MSLLNKIKGNTLYFKIKKIMYRQTIIKVLKKKHYKMISKKKKREQKKPTKFNEKINI